MAMTRVVTVTGAGGVGKTTVSAALAIRHARAGAKTLVVTVDPARRLGQALGLAALDRDPHPTGEDGLWAAMLDAEGSWQDIAERHATPEAAARLSDNPFFDAVARRFPASQAYAAADTMTREAESGRWDVIVVDTPPSAGGVEFFTAPTDLLALINGPLIRALTGGGIPGSRALFRVTLAPLLKLADGLLGSAVLEDLTAFLFDLRTTADGLTRRAEEIDAVQRRSTTIVVTSPDPAAITEAEHFSDLLPGVATTPAAVVFNRAVPPEWEAAEVPDEDHPAIAAFGLWAAEARRQRGLRDELVDALGVEVTTVPWRAKAPVTLSGLGELLPTGFLP
ncbi:MAG: ArsA family ATPase [Acidimicrobiia bacterium]|nr:ArsA family ATPase [Acidimicrobiia bacterium]